MAKRSDPRDPQKWLLYRAEHDLGLGGFFIGLDDVQRYVDSITKSRWWQNRCDIQWVTVEYRQSPNGDCFAERTRPGRGRIVLIQPHLCETYILHELTHLLSAGTKQDHGPLFAANLLKMVGHWMNVWYEADLRAAFDKYGVDYKPREER